MLTVEPPRIYLAPLQEYTDLPYRATHAMLIGGVDRYFAPYLVCQNDGSIKGAQRRDVDPTDNKDYPLIPQIMAGGVDDFLFLARELESMGYREINWNLGCPYPMVTRKGMGSGLLPQPQRIRTVLDQALPKLSARISVKMRIGLESPEELLPVIEVLNDFPLTEVIIHPRLGKQLYKGVPSHDRYGEAVAILRHPIVYNGDLCSPDDLQRLALRFPVTSAWMAGRGMLKNPWLPLQLKGLPLPHEHQQRKILEQFENTLFSQYARRLSGTSHLLLKMEKFWSYFSYAFPDQHKTFKRIKKAKSIVQYEEAVKANFKW